MYIHQLADYKERTIKVSFCVLGMASTEIPSTERVREFLSETVHSFLGRCDFKRVAASLRAANVISAGEFQRLQACPLLEDANRFLYSLLDGDPSTRKLGALSAALKVDTTHDGHQELAQLIDQFLQGEVSFYCLT